MSRKLMPVDPPTMQGGGRLTPSEADRLRSLTFPGQAHWGVLNRSCRECLFWNKDAAPVYYASTSTLRPQRCAKAVSLMRISDIPKVPYHARGCKYFEENPNPPPLERPRKGKK